MDVTPRALTEFITSSPAMVENWPCNGVATAAAMVSGDAPGNCAVTWIVGNSTAGNSETGRLR